MREAASGVSSATLSWEYPESLVLSVFLQLSQHLLVTSLPKRQLVTISYYNPFLLKLATVDSVYCCQEPSYVGVHMIEWSLVEKGYHVPGTIDKADIIMCITSQEAHKIHIAAFTIQMTETQVTEVR